MQQMFEEETVVEESGVLGGVLSQKGASQQASRERAHVAQGLSTGACGYLKPRHAAAVTAESPEWLRGEADKAKAHQLLDKVKAGDWASDQAIRQALRTLGETPYSKQELRDLEATHHA
jgi:DNA-binding response OmpR family regulator